MTAFDTLQKWCKACKGLPKERLRLDDEDKAALVELARQAKEERLVVRALSEWEADIGQCPLCERVFPWRWFKDTKNQHGDIISACESCAEADKPEPGLSKTERGL